MILVTVGMQLGFDRLIKAMDDLAPSLGVEVIAQTGVGSYQAKNFDTKASIAPAEFEALVSRAQLIVSHAGIGTVLTAQRFGKPILLFPRRFSQGEHRNDHQVATVSKLGGRPGILVAMEESELRPQIHKGLEMEGITHEVSSAAIQLREAISSFIEGTSI